MPVSSQINSSTAVIEPMHQECDDDTVEYKSSWSWSLVLSHGQNQLVEARNAKGILATSCSLSKVALPEYSLPTTLSDSSFRISVSIDGDVVGSGTGGTVKEATAAAAVDAITRLKRVCCVLLKKNTVDPTVESIAQDSLVTSKTATSSVALPASNVGSKLLAKMGWTGGGVGKCGQGIAAPITVQEVFQRQGLGMSVARGVTREFNQAVSATLQEYAESEREEDLVFASDFSNEQRKKIHNLCRRFKLKSQSYGKDEGRQLVIMKVRGQESVLDLLRRCGGENGKFKLLAPGGKPFVQLMSPLSDDEMM